MNAMRALQNAKYVNLRTYRNNGSTVDTPVWCAPGEDDELFIFSAGDAGKVKRLRNSSRAHANSIEQALTALHNKYGWQMWLADAGAKLTGRFNKRAYIRANLV